MTIAAIPSPSTAVWELGPVPIRAYALCIVLGIVVACAVTEVRLRRRGAPPWAVLDVGVWAVAFGVIGARIYHVITSPQSYFGAEGRAIEALYIWQGGLGIWGAIAGGALGAWLGCRQLGIPLSVFADALAPGLPLAQAVGRFGNWFNNELHGGLTTLPWGLEVHRMDPDSPGRALRDADGNPILLPGLYHPAFLYEAVWNVGVALMVWAADRRFKFGRGRAFALYVMGYTAGRVWIEALRTDPATEILGARLNVWVSILVFIGALIYFLRVHGPREYLIPVAAAGSATDGVTVVGDEAERADADGAAVTDDAPARDAADAAATDDAAAEPGSEPDKADADAEPEPDKVDAEAEPEPDKVDEAGDRAAAAAATGVGFRVVTEAEYLEYLAGSPATETGAAGDDSPDDAPTDDDGKVSPGVAAGSGQRDDASVPLEKSAD